MTFPETRRTPCDNAAVPVRIMLARTIAPSYPARPDNAAREMPHDYVGNGANGRSADRRLAICGYRDESPSRRQDCA